MGVDVSWISMIFRENMGTDRLVSSDKKFYAYMDSRYAGLSHGYASLHMQNIPVHAGKLNFIGIFIFQSPHSQQYHQIPRTSEKRIPRGIGTLSDWIETI